MLMVTGNHESVQHTIADFFLFCQVLLPKSINETTWTSSKGWRRVTIIKSYLLTQGGHDRTVYIVFIIWLWHMAPLGTFNYVYMIRSVTSLSFTLVWRKCTNIWVALLYSMFPQTDTSPPELQWSFSMFYHLSILCSMIKRCCNTLRNCSCWQGVLLLC